MLKYSQLFPSLGNAGSADQATMNSFFGTNGSSTGYKFNNMEKIPANWYSRATPYTILDVATEIGAQYEQYPVAFGGNVGKGNFVGYVMILMLCKSQTNLLTALARMVHRSRRTGCFQTRLLLT